jgi:hypothetical protein
MKDVTKKSLLLIPALRRYVERNRAMAARAHALENEIRDLQQIVSRSRNPALFGSVNDLLTERLLAHAVMSPLPPVELGSESAIDNPQRIDFAERLLVAYHAAMSDGTDAPLKRDGTDMWTELMRGELSELMSIIARHDARQLALSLVDFGRSFVWFGGITTCIDGFNRNLNLRHVALTYLDKLICLGEAIGIVRVENPESGSWGSNLHVDVDQLIDDIEIELGISIAPPMGIIHTDGLRTKKGLFHYRHIAGLYGAVRISNLVGSSGKVCEFGGGLGITAMYARRLGILDYTMLDLPITCLLAGHYLLHALGRDSVVLYGEESRDCAIKILPYWECEKFADKAYEMTVNQDSFPEIAENLVNEYLVQIQRFTSGHFLSINHEYSFPRTVHNVVRRHRGYRRVYRSKCWVREGYVEELYRVQ